jgi:hypothetical protein
MPRDTPKSKPIKLVRITFEVSTAINAKDDITPNVIQTIRNLFRSIFFAVKAPTKADNISPEKWKPQIVMDETESPGKDLVASSRKCKIA